MAMRGYTVLGWLTWRVATWLARRKLRANRGRLIALTVVAAVLAAGIALASGERE
jgi:hypothetical protein